MAAVDSEPSSFNACSRHDSQNLAGASTSDNKWACKMCTYLNWPRSLRCVQCYTKKGAVLETIPSQDIGAASVILKTPTPPNELEQKPSASHKRFTNHHLKESKSQIDGVGQIEPGNNQLQERLSRMHIASKIDAEMNASNSAASAAGAAAQRLSPIGSSTTHLNNLANSSQSQQLHSSPSVPANVQQHSYIAKWPCNVRNLLKLYHFQNQFFFCGLLFQTCTYENFPKSLKCSMCGSPRDSNITENNASGSNNQQNNSGSDKMNDTVSSNNSFNKQQNIYQLGKQYILFYEEAMNVYSIVFPFKGSSDTINNCDTVQERQERRQRQIRRQVDWQWLNACLGRFLKYLHIRKKPIRLP